MIGALDTEAFANHAATGSGIFTTGGAAPTLDTSLAPATVVYDRESNGYTIAANSRIESFLPLDLDSSVSTAELAVYTKLTGDTADSLTLTKAGTSGRFTYRYVGSGFWQRVTTDSTATRGTLDAFAYGAATPSNALPRTGRSEYTVDLIGARTLNNNIFGITGQGVAQVDFSTGTIVTHGTVKTPFSSTSPFSSEARMSSSNSFSGLFRIDDFGLFEGTVEGQFYGPNAEEMGAAFSAGNNSHIFVGAITGRGSPATSTNATIKTPTVNEFFTSTSAKMVTTLQNYSPSSGGNGFSDSAAAASPLIVNYSSASNDYTVISSDISQYFKDRRDVNRGRIQEILLDATLKTNLDGYDYSTFLNLNYVTAKRWMKRTDVGGELQYRVEQFVFGKETSDVALPRVGSGGYAIGLRAVVADANFSDLAYLTGFGFLQANFATGALAASGSLRVYEAAQIITSAYVGTGNFSLTGNISSTGNSFSGPITFDGLGTYSGTHNGRFFGPAAQEIGGAFSAENATGGTAIGTFTGGLDAVATATTPKLSELTAATNVAFEAIKVGNSAPIAGQTVSVSYDPRTSSYSLSFQDTHLTGSPTHVATLSSANRDNGASDSAFGVHTGTINGESYTAKLLNPATSNSLIVLSYTSLAEFVMTQGGNSAWDERHYAAFGQQTNALRMPRSGTATYNGIAIGFGTQRTNVLSGGSPPSVYTEYNVSGQIALAADFGAGRISSHISLQGYPIGAGTTTAFSPIVTAGIINGNGFRIGDSSNMVVGKFFGPTGEEVGGTFTYSHTGGEGTSTNLKGAFVGAR